MAARAVTLRQMKSPSLSCFHAEIAVNLLWSLKNKTRAFIVAEIAFLFGEHALRGNIEYS